MAAVGEKQMAVDMIGARPGAARLDIWGKGRRVGHRPMGVASVGPARWTTGKGGARVASAGVSLTSARWECSGRTGRGDDQKGERP